MNKICPPQWFAAWGQCVNISCNFKSMLHFKNNFSNCWRKICSLSLLQTMEIGTFMLQIRRTHHRSRLHGPGMHSRDLVISFLYSHDSVCLDCRLYSIRLYSSLTVFLPLLVLTDHRISLSLLNYHSFGLLLGGSKATVRNCLSIVSTLLYNFLVWLILIV